MHRNHINNAMMRCLNCSVATRRIRRHIVNTLTPQLQNILAEWLSIEVLPSDGLICKACYVLLNQCSVEGTHCRALGYPMVCIGCGRSVMGKRYPVRYHTVEDNSPLVDIFFSWYTHYQDPRTKLLACHSCWTRAKQHWVLNIRNEPKLPLPPHPPAANTVGARRIGRINYLPRHKCANTSNERELNMDEDSLAPEPTEDHNGNEIKVFCPKCNSEVSHSAEGIQLDQTKMIIAKVYHYFEQEYEELKKTIPGIEQTPLSMFRQRTALATGVSETMVEEILQEEARRNEEMQQEILRQQNLACKRQRPTDSSSEDDSDESDDFGDEQPEPSAVEETETLVIKEEPVESYSEEPEIYVELPSVKVEPGVSGDNTLPADPISIDVKIEPRTVEATTSNEPQAVQRATKSKAKKTKLNTDTSPATHVPPTVTARPAATASPTTSASPSTSATPRRQLLLLEGGEVKMEQPEIDEEGFS